MPTDLDPDIKTRPDGSIDTAYYIQKGRVARAHQARHLTQTVLRATQHERKAPGIARLWQMLMPRYRYRF
jgi:hypothetical protein